MMKHTLIRNTIVLCVAGFGLGSCKKEVTQRVDQAFSATYTLTPANWQADGASYFTDIPVPEVDPVIVASGGVLVYLSFDNGVSFDALPEVVNGVSYGTYHSNQTVSIDFTSATGTGAVTPPTKNIIAKLVVIDATPLD